jgi:hypothetical protein
MRYAGNLISFAGLQRASSTNAAKISRFRHAALDDEQKEILVQALW